MPKSTSPRAKKVTSPSVVQSVPLTSEVILRLHQELGSVRSQTFQRGMGVTPYGVTSLNEDEASQIFKVGTFNVPDEILREKVNHLANGLAQRCIPMCLGLLRGLNSRFRADSRFPFVDYQSRGPSPAYWQGQLRNDDIFSEVYQHAGQIVSDLWLGGCACCDDYPRMGLRDDRQITKHLAKRRADCQNGHVLSGWRENETLDSFLFRSILNGTLKSQPESPWTLATWAWKRSNRANDLATGMLLYRIRGAGAGDHLLMVVPYAACSGCGNREVTSNDHCGCKTTPAIHVVRSIVVEGAFQQGGELRRCPECCSDDCPACRPDPNAMHKTVLKHKRRLFFGSVCPICKQTLEPRITQTWQSVGLTQSHARPPSKTPTVDDDDWEQQAFKEGFHDGPHQPLRDAWNRTAPNDSSNAQSEPDEIDQRTSALDGLSEASLRCAIGRFEDFKNRFSAGERKKLDAVFNEVLDVLTAKLDVLTPTSDADPASTREDRYVRYRSAIGSLQKALGKKQAILIQLAEYLSQCRRETHT